MTARRTEPTGAPSIVYPTGKLLKDGREYRMSYDTDIRARFNALKQAEKPKPRLARSRP